MSSSSTDTRPPPDPQSRTPLNLTVPVERLRSSSQPGQGHVLDHPRTQWRHGGLLSLMRRRALARPTASTKYTPSATTPAFTTRPLGEAVPSNYNKAGRAKDDGTCECLHRRCCPGD